MLAWMVLSGKRLCSSLQSLQGQRVRVPQVDVVELALTLAERYPVGTPGAACRKGERMIDERKRALLLQPVVPGRGPNEDRINLSL